MSFPPALASLAVSALSVSVIASTACGGASQRPAVPAASIPDPPATALGPPAAPGVPVGDPIVAVEPATANPTAAGPAVASAATAAPSLPASETPPAPLVMLLDEPPCHPMASRSARAQSLDPHRTGHASHAAHERHGRGGRPYHPAPGIIVDVVDARGGTSAANLQHTARDVGYWPFRQCYEEGLRRDQHLSGKVFLDLTVTPTGSVERSTASSATVRDDSVAACVAREASRLPMPPADSPTAVKMSVSLSTGDEPVPVPRPLPNADDLHQALRASWGAVVECYTRELAARPNAGGRMELRFSLHPSDDVVDVAEGDTHFDDPDVTRCVVGVYRATPLPLAQMKRPADFVYALHFESKPEP